MEEEMAVRKKTVEGYEMETTRWKQLLEREQACTHRLELERSLLWKQVDNNKVEIKRLEQQLIEEGANLHKLVRDKYSDVKVGFSFAH
jgi:hypothetical protein